MARLVYSCRFDVAAKDGIENVLSTYRDWIIGHYRDRQDIPDFEFEPEVAIAPKELPDGHSLTCSPYEIEDERAVQIHWSHPDSKDAGLRWANEIRVGQFGDCCSVEHLIFIESVKYNVVPAKLLFGSPRVILDICAKVPVRIGEMQLRAEPYPLGKNELADMLRILTSEHRRLPVVLLSPYARGDLNQIDSARLALNLAGVAAVVQARNPDLTWDFTDEVGRQLSCFNGAARIYWPGFSKTCNPRSHHLFLGDWIEKVGTGWAALKIERTIFEVAAFRYVPDNRIADLIRRVQSEERRRILAEKKEKAEEDFLSEYERDLTRLDDAEKKIKELEAENANLRCNQKVFFETGTDKLAESEETEELSPTSVSAAVKLAKQKLKNLDILDTAISAAKQSPFNRPYDVFTALTHLDKFVDGWRKKQQETGGLLKYLKDQGWRRSSMHISVTAKGKEQLFEPHITIGAKDPNSCASIHFIFDKDRSPAKIVVAHVGKHLPNTKT